MYSSLSTTLVVVYVVLLILASASVAVRFKVRKDTKTGLAAEDYTILAALLWQYAAAAMSIFGAVAGGQGDSAQNLEKHPKEAARFEKILFAGPLFFATSIALIKISTLLLYKRIFITKKFHIACYTVMVLTISWLLVSIFGQIFQSKPISKSWTAPGRFYVINVPVFLVSLAAINTALDLVIVCLPLFVISTLRMSSKHKLFVSGIFLLGLFCIVASAIRLYYLVLLNQRFRPAEFDQRTVTEDIIWSFIEPQMSIVAACLPTLAPLYRDGRAPASLRKGAQPFFSLGNISFRRSGKGSKESRDTDMRHGWVQLNPSINRSDNA